MIPSLSSIFTSDAIAGISWPLGPGSTPPLYFQPLEKLFEIRGSSEFETKTCSPLTKNTNGFEVTKLPSLVSTMSANNETTFFEKIALALLLLGYGYTDECHNLITPLSWPSDISFAAGPSVYDQASSAVRAYASYAHCLVHRKEAFNIGEFGMVGFSNANYWANAVESCGRQGVDSLPHDEWRNAIIELSRDNVNGFAENPNVQAWCRENGFQAEKSTGHFDPRALHGLCAKVLKESDKADPIFRDFAEKAVASEVQILLRKSLKKAGMTIQDEALKI